MRFAIISDIHGNDKALEAVLEDAQRNHIDEFIFVGDYYCDLPYPNQVADRIKKIKEKHVIRGNKEEYLMSLYGTDMSEWNYHQFNALYWNFRELTAPNLHYLMSLPKTKRIRVGTKNILILHSISDLFKDTQLKRFSSSKFAEMMDEREHSREEFLDYVQQTLEEDKELLEQLDNREDDVYIFGHTHLQWFSHVGNRTLINGGSCGVPLDFCIGAPYTILDITDDEVRVEERRVEYDVRALIDQVRKSKLYACAEGWIELIINHLELARDDIAFFFRYMNKVKSERNNKSWPIDNDLWDEVMKQWLNRSRLK